VAGQPDIVRKYLSGYAEPEARLSLRLPGRYEHVLVVPVHDEAPSWLEGPSAALGHAPRSLLIAVVNASPASPASGRARNLEELQSLASRARSARCLHSQPPIFLLEFDEFDLLLVDRTSPGFELPAREGVGLARRIGCDLALRLIAEGQVTSPYLGCTDADATLPQDYFTRIGEGPEERAALLLPFEHVASPRTPKALHQATLLYESSLRYLTLGLSWAGSPFAYTAVGSSIAVHAHAYAQVRGFPRRLAGEDFHLLAKLAKVGTVERLRGNPIRLESRLSARVPFGTGPSVSELLTCAPDGDASGSVAAFYHPEVFVGLSHLLRWLSELAKDPVAAQARGFEPGPTRAGQAIQQYLEQPAFAAALERVLRQPKHPSQRLQHLHTWFDALKTVRLLHHLRDTAFENPPWREALELSPFVPGFLASHPVLSITQALRRAELDLPPVVGVAPAQLVDP
jgi:hypothetical protein